MHPSHPRLSASTLLKLKLKPLAAQANTKMHVIRDGLPSGDGSYAGSVGSVHLGHGGNRLLDLVATVGG